MRIGIGILALVVCSMLGACGSDDDGGGGGGGNSSAATSSCRSYCDKDQTANCGTYTSASECYEYECTIAPGAPQACLDAIKAYYDCYGAAADVCSLSNCSAEFDALFQACS